MKRKRKGLRGLGMDSFACSAEKLHLTRKRLNSGGYDENGRYFGRGEPLYFFNGSSPQTSIFGHLRASSRTAAKAKLLAKCPLLKFAR